MSHPDYQQTSKDHSSLLVLVKHIGGRLSSRAFNRAYDRISKNDQLSVTDSHGRQRSLSVRYVKTYPVENNDWGEFQAHRRVLGLICVGQCSSASEVSELCRLHESLKVKYSSTVYDSRCILFGLHQDGTPYTPPVSSEESIDEEQPAHRRRTLSEPRQAENLPPPDPEKDRRESRPSPSAIRKFLLPQDLKKRLKQRSRSASPEGAISPYRRLEIPPDLTNSLGNVLNKVEETNGNMRASGHSLASNSRDSSLQPGSEEDVSSPSLSVRTGSNASGANLSQASVPHNTRTLFYPSYDLCSDIEVDLNEFLSSLFWILESKRLDKLMEKSERIPLLCAPFERRDFIGLETDSRSNRKRCLGRWKKHVADITLQAGLLPEALELYTSACDILKSLNDWLWLAGALEGQASASSILTYPNLKHSIHPLQRVASFGESGSGRAESGMRSLPVHLDNSEKKKLVKHCLSPDAIVERYHEAIVHYSKYRNAGTIETEASVKAVQILIEQKKILRAADFLQNVVFINLQLNDDEKIHRFCALSSLYRDIGFHRKAALFKRIAAMRCVAPQNPHPNWSQCYQLLYQCLPGFDISLDPSVFCPSTRKGWVTLQVQVLQEMIGTARRMGNYQLAVRHAALLLHALSDAMNPASLVEFAKQIEGITGKSETSVAPIVLDSGIVIPPVNLLFIPKVRVFRVVNLPLHLRPLKIIPDVKDHGPFLYTPIQYGSSRQKKDLSKVAFNLVAGDLCEVVLTVFNPMPFELKISEMNLLSEGVEFASNSCEVILPVGSVPHSVMLTGIPKTAGELTFTGYTTKFLGIKSQCKLKNIPQIAEDHYKVQVVESLPVLNIVGESPRKHGNSVNTPSGNGCTISIVVYAGESSECNLMLINNSSQPVETVDLSLVSKSDKCKEMFTWSEDNLKSQLPIKPGTSASLTVYINGTSTFLCQGGRQSDEADFCSILSAGPPQNSLMSGPGSLFSRISGSAMASIPLGLRSQKSRRTESSLSMSSHRSGSSSKSNGSSRMGRATDLMSSDSGKSVSASLKLNYSGGPGRSAGFMRTASVSVHVEVLPSVLITKWDMLPSEMPDHCYLVLDILNITQHEIEVQYASTKCIAIEGGESCRIPVPVERCPLNKIEHLYTVREDGKLGPIDESEVNRICCEHIASLVDLKWVMNLSSLGDHVSVGSGSLRELCGKANLNGIVCTPAMLNLIRMYPVRFDVNVDGAPWSPEKGEVHISPGEAIQVSVSVSNKLNIPIKFCKLKVVCFLDYQNGHSSSRLDGRVLMMNGDSTFLQSDIMPRANPGQIRPITLQRCVVTTLTTLSSMLSPGESSSYSCGISFFTSGQYKVEFQCTTGDYRNQMNTDYGSLATTPSDFHCWKFTPPVDVTVS